MTESLARLWWTGHQVKARLVNEVDTETVKCREPSGAAYLSMLFHTVSKELIVAMVQALNGCRQVSSLPFGTVTRCIGADGALEIRAALAVRV